MAENKQDEVVVVCDAVREAFLPLLERLWLPFVHDIQFTLSNYDLSVWPSERREVERQMKALLTAHAKKQTKQPEHGWVLAVVLDELYAGRPVTGMMLACHRDPPSATVYR
jgi:hypothetical protein